MAIFYTTETLIGRPYVVPAMSKAICDYFKSAGYEVKEDESSTGSKEISIAERGIFKTILGQKTALNISIQPTGDVIRFKAYAGIFGSQALRALITYYVWWPMIFTQIWGLIKQSHLDDKALEIAKSVLSSYNYTGQAYASGNYCHHCGSSTPNGTRFCPHCGSQI